MWSDAVSAKRTEMMKFIRDLKVHVRLKGLSASEQRVQDVLEYLRSALEYLRFDDLLSAQNAFRNARGQAKESLGFNAG